jgi:hypothetical protein
VCPESEFVLASNLEKALAVGPNNENNIFEGDLLGIL